MFDPALIKEIGGGLSAVVILALGAANVIQYRRNNALQDKLLELTQIMGKENRDLLAQTNLAISTNTEVMNRAILETANLVRERR